MELCRNGVQATSYDIEGLNTEAVPQLARNQKVTVLCVQSADREIVVIDVINRTACLAKLHFVDPHRCSAPQKIQAYGRLES